MPNDLEVREVLASRFLIGGQHTDVVKLERVGKALSAVLKVFFLSFFL